MPKKNNGGGVESTAVAAGSARQVHGKCTIQNAVKNKPYVVHYAIKANANERILERIKKSGFRS